MGFGDAIMASALVRGFHAQGKLAAFFSPDGNHRRIKWTGVCEDILAYNPNVAKPAQETKANLIWLPHYKKVFPYCRYDGQQRKYIWNYNFKAEPGEIFFAPNDVMPRVSEPFIIIEPNVAWQRSSNINKDWGEGKYEALTKALVAHGCTVVQCIHSNSRRKLRGAQQIVTTTFRQAIRIMANASLAIVPEGGNHHAAAAVSVPAIVLWGAWSPPQTMGYASQIKLTGQEQLGCGNTDLCPHCRAAFAGIGVEEVYEAAMGVMQR